jgi:hypothetical protein
MCGLAMPDEAYDRALVVFTGTCEKVERLSAPANESFERAVGSITRFAVDEYFKGSGAPTVELHGGFTSCDFNFQEGTRYVVFASTRPEDGSLTTHSCSGTFELNSSAKATVAYLRRRAAGERPTMLYGFVLKSGSAADGRVDQSVWAGLRIVVEGKGKRVELTSDESGFFEVFDLPAGSYRVSLEAEGKVRGAEAQTIEIRDGAVSWVSFRTTTTGGLRGRLTDVDGAALAETEILLLPAKDPRPEAPGAANAQSFDGGRFEFPEVAAGSYVLAVNPTGRRSLYYGAWSPNFYPDAAAAASARPVVVENGKVEDVGDFVITRRFPTVALRGVLVSKDGKPIAGAVVDVTAQGEWDAVRSVRSDADGNFTASVFEGVTYDVSAVAELPEGGRVESERVPVKAAKDAPATRMVLRPRAQTEPGADESPE